MYSAIYFGDCSFLSGIMFARRSVIVDRDCPHNAIGIIKHGKVTMIAMAISAVISFFTCPLPINYKRNKWTLLAAILLILVLGTTVIPLLGSFASGLVSELQGDFTGQMIFDEFGPRMVGGLIGGGVRRH